MTARPKPKTKSYRISGTVRSSVMLDGRPAVRYVDCSWDRRGRDITVAEEDIVSSDEWVVRVRPGAKVSTAVSSRNKTGKETP